MLVRNVLPKWSRKFFPDFRPSVIFPKRSSSGGRFGSMPPPGCRSWSSFFGESSERTKLERKLANWVWRQLVWNAKWMRDRRYDLDVEHMIDEEWSRWRRVEPGGKPVEMMWIKKSGIGWPNALGATRNRMRRSWRKVKFWCSLFSRIWYSLFSRKWRSLCFAETHRVLVRNHRSTFHAALTMRKIHRVLVKKYRKWKRSTTCSFAVV